MEYSFVKYLKKYVNFNTDWSNEGTYKNRLKCDFSDNELKQIVNDYTRVTASTKTIIDYIITNNTNITANNYISNKITDREAIYIKINIIPCSDRHFYCVNLNKCHY